MSHAVESLVRHCFRGESGRQRDVALAIADGCPDHTGERMFKAILTIAHLADVGHSTAERAIAHFVKVGWLIKVRAGGYGPRSTTEYRICPEWMRLAGEEIAASLAERRLSRRVPIDPAERAPKVEAPKHPNLGCLKEGLSTPIEAPKHPNFEAKHPKNEPKHPISWGTNYEHRTNTLNINPLPPKGGSPVDNSNIEKNPQTIKSLLADLIALHPRHDASDTPSASRVLTAMVDRAGEGAAHAALRERLCAGMANDAKRWREEWGGRCPRLSKWLRGMAQLGAMPAGNASQALTDDSRSSVEAKAKAAGLPPFDQWQLAQYQATGQTPPWAHYLRTIERAENVVSA